MIADGNSQQLNSHIVRLMHSCRCLCIGNVSFTSLKKELITIASKHKLAVLKVIITAGSGGRGYSRKGASSPTIVISIHEFPTHYDKWHSEGITLGDSSLKIGLNPLLAGLKHLNRLEQVLIRKELDEKPEDDIVVYNVNSHIVEVSAGNIFWLIAGKLYTPELSNAGVDGLMRQFIIEKASRIPSIEPVNVVSNKQESLAKADSIFVCNSVMGIVPIKSYNGNSKSIAPIIELQSLFESLL